MKLKHTPGPWYYDFEKTHNNKWGGGTIPIYPTVQPSHEYSEIAEVAYYGELGKANARLIAASPETLKCLIKEFKSSVKQFGLEKAKMLETRYAIESATGLPIEEVLK